MPWPLEPEGIRAFASGLERMIVVEEKRGPMEQQIRGLLNGDSGAQRSVVGKKDETAATQFQAELALNPIRIAATIGARLPVADLQVRARAATRSSASRGCRR